MKPKLILITFAMVVSISGNPAAAMCGNLTYARALFGTPAAKSPDIRQLQKGLRLRLTDKDAKLADGLFGPYTMARLKNLCEADVTGRGGDEPLQAAVAIALAYADLPGDIGDIVELVAQKEFTTNFAAIVLDDAPAKPERLAELAANWRPDTVVSKETEAQKTLSEPLMFDDEAGLRSAIFGALLTNTALRTAVNEAVGGAQVFELDPAKVQELGNYSKFSDYHSTLEELLSSPATSRESLEAAVLARVQSQYEQLAAERVEVTADLIVSQATTKVSPVDNARHTDLAPDAYEPVGPIMAVTRAALNAISDPDYRDALAKERLQSGATPETQKADIIRVLNEVEAARGEDVKNAFANKLPDLIRVRYRLAPDTYSRFAQFDFNNQTEIDSQAALESKRERDEELRKLHKAHGEALVELRRLRTVIAAIRELSAD